MLSFGKPVTFANKGAIMLKKASHIPEREQWVHRSPQVKRGLLKGIKEAKMGKLKKNALNLKST